MMLIHLMNGSVAIMAAAHTLITLSFCTFKLTTLGMLDMVVFVNHNGYKYDISCTLLQDFRSYVGSHSGTYTNWVNYLDVEGGFADLNVKIAKVGTSDIDMGFGTTTTIVHVDGKTPSNLNSCCPEILDYFPETAMNPPSEKESLRRFGGTVLFVSHDRYFINRVADHLLVADGGDFRVFEGAYDAWVAWQAAHNRDPQPTSASECGPHPSNSLHTTSPVERAESRPKWRFPFRKIVNIEADIARGEARIERIHHQMTDPEKLRDGAQIKALKEELSQTERQLAQLLEHWEEAHQRSGA